jgi:hypothetical protein
MRAELFGTYNPASFRDHPEKDRFHLHCHPLCGIMIAEYERLIHLLRFSLSLLLREMNKRLQVWQLASSLCCNMAISY